MTKSDDVLTDLNALAASQHGSSESVGAAESVYRAIQTLRAERDALEAEVERLRTHIDRLEGRWPESKEPWDKFLKRPNLAAMY